VTWSYTCAPNSTTYPGFPVCDSSQYLFEFGSDPAVAWDDQDRAYVVARFTDGGGTWSSHGVVIDSWNDTDLEDENFYAIDTTLTSPTTDATTPAGTATTTRSSPLGQRRTSLHLGSQQRV
jgi:hypothetical protein